MKHKKANLAYNWVEYLFLFLMFVGLVLALKIGSAVMSYIIISLCGLISGRAFYKLRKNITFPFYIIILGFLLGYLIGSYYGNKQLIVIFFVIANIVGYFIYDKGYLE